MKKGIIAILNEKGGVGKTATTEALNDGLRLRGKKVLCIDMDLQTNLTAAMSADRDKPNIIDLINGEATPAEAIQDTGRAHIIAGSRSLATLSGSPAALRDALQATRCPVNTYDYVLIDCPPSMGLASLNALTAATAAIIPTTADAFSLQALGNVWQTVQTVQAQANEALYISGIVLTRWSSRTIITRELTAMIEQAAAQMGTRVFNTRVRECTSLREAEANRESIFDYAPRSHTAKDYNSLINELLEDVK